MTTERRRGIVVRPNGAVWDESVYRWWLDQVDRRSEPPRLARLSAEDPFCQSVEQASRSRAAR